MRLRGITATTGSFRLFALPEHILANILRRCATIGGLPVTVALAQLRLTGSMDPNWLLPLLHLATRCPALRGRLTRHLRSIELLSGYNESLEALVPQLTRLESLTSEGPLSSSLLASLPVSLTRLSLGCDGASNLPASLARLTALEELELDFDLPLGIWGPMAYSSLPTLRRLSCKSLPMGLHIGILAPNLEALDIKSSMMQFGLIAHLPLSTTRLHLGPHDLHPGPLLALTRLSGLRDLALPSATSHLAELPAIVAGLPALSRLHIASIPSEDVLLKLVEALERLPNGQLGIRLFSGHINTAPGGLERLLPSLLEAGFNDGACDNLAWQTMTRLTRLQLHCGVLRASGIQGVTRLAPGLRELDIEAWGSVPNELGALTRITRLHLERVCRPFESAKVSCLQRLARLRTCKCHHVPVECLKVLPDSLTKLALLVNQTLPALPLGEALQHLTALEELVLRWPEGEDRVCDLSPLQRLTRLKLMGAALPLVHLGPLLCLLRLHLESCKNLNEDGFIFQVVCLTKLRELRLDATGGLKPLADAGLAPLTRLSLLEVLELPEKLGYVTPDGIGRLLDQLPLLGVLYARGISPELLQDPKWAKVKRESKGRLMVQKSQAQLWPPLLVFP